MTALRTSLYLLLAFNLACIGVIAMPLFGMQPPFMGHSEPTRMANQLFPEKLRVVAQADTPASTSGSSVEPASAPVAAAVSEPAPDIQSPAHETPATGHVASTAATGDNACVAFANLTPTQAQALAQRARGTGTSLTVREIEATPSSYWVNIPPQGGKAGADRRAAELRELGLEDFFIEQKPGDDRYAISLGLFKGESLAQRQLETLLKRGVKGARVTPRQNPNGARVELAGAGDQIERVARDAAADIKGSERETCKAG